SFDCARSSSVDTVTSAVWPAPVKVNSNREQESTETSLSLLTLTRRRLQPCQGQQRVLNLFPMAGELPDRKLSQRTWASVPGIYVVEMETERVKRGVK